jgi:hypothetical protein
VHGDVTAFVFLIFLFAAGAVVTALLFPRLESWTWAVSGRRR